MQLQWLQWKALSILDAAEKEGDARTALGAIREARANLELLARLEGELADNPQPGDLLGSPEWLAIRAALLEALRAFPEARAEVAEKLLLLEEGGLG
jgi:hypothetical protein